MNNKQIIVILIYLLIVGAFGFSWGHSVGTHQQLDKIKKLETEKENLEQGKIEYQWLYESCLTSYGDYQDRYELSCEVSE